MSKRVNEEQNIAKKLKVEKVHDKKVGVDTKDIMWVVEGGWYTRLQHITYKKESADSIYTYFSELDAKKRKCLHTVPLNRRKYDSIRGKMKELYLLATMEKDKDSSDGGSYPTVLEARKSYCPTVVFDRDSIVEAHDCSSGHHEDYLININN